MRTEPSVKYAPRLPKVSGFGSPGTVAHMFEHAAVFVFKGDEEAVLDCLVMADADVLEVECEDDTVTVMAPNTEFAKARNALTDEFENIDFEVDEIQFVPKETPISGEDLEQFEKLLDTQQMRRRTEHLSRREILILFLGVLR